MTITRENGKIAYHVNDRATAIAVQRLLDASGFLRKNDGAVATFDKVELDMSRARAIPTMDAVSPRNDLTSRLDALIPQLSSTNADQLAVGDLVKMGMLTAQQAISALISRLGLFKEGQGSSGQIAALEAFVTTRAKMTDEGTMDAASPRGKSVTAYIRGDTPKPVTGSSVKAFLRS